MLRCCVMIRVTPTNSQPAVSSAVTPSTTQAMRFLQVELFEQLKMLKTLLIKKLCNSRKFLRLLRGKEE